MIKIQFKEINKGLRLLHIGEYSRIYQLPNGNFFKAFNITYLNMFKQSGFDMERKILETPDLVTNSSIIKPISAVYNGGLFVGFIMPRALGINYNEWDSNLSLRQRSNLLMYANQYKRLEDIIKNTPNIVYPDICTCDNIYVNSSGIQLIDYDGLQINNHPTVSFSTTLGDYRTYLPISKYCDNSEGGFPLFTKELDKKSLILLYFLTTFNIDLNKVGSRVPGSNRVLTLDDLFKILNLNDYDMMHKVWKLFNDKEQNDWLGEDVFRIADNYKMVVDPRPIDGKYLKKLVRR